MRQAAGEDVAREQQYRQPVDVAVAAPVTMLVAPGPIDEVQAKVWSRFFILA